MLARLYRASIWHPLAIPADDSSASSKRIWLPLYDGGLMVGGVIAILVGVPAFDEVLTEPIADVTGAALFVLGATCLTGIAFPRLWALELLSKIGVVFLFGAYFATLVALAIQAGTGTRDFVAVIAFLAIVGGPMGRISTLAKEWGVRIANRRTTPQVIQ